MFWFLSSQLPCLNKTSFCVFLENCTFCDSCSVKVVLKEVWNVYGKIFLDSVLTIMKFIQMCLIWYIIKWILINMRKSIFTMLRVFFAPDCIVKGPEIEHPPSPVGCPKYFSIFHLILYNVDLCEKILLVIRLNSQMFNQSAEIVRFDMMSYPNSSFNIQLRI